MGRPDQPDHQRATAAIPRLVAIVLAQGCQPLRINPNGNPAVRQSVDRTDAEHHQRVAVKPVQQAARPGQREYIPAVSISMSPMPR